MLVLPLLATMLARDSTDHTLLTLEWMLEHSEPHSLGVLLPPRSLPLGTRQGGTAEGRSGCG